MKRTLLLGSAIAVAGLSVGFVGRFRPGRPRAIAPVPVVEVTDSRRPVPAFDEGARNAAESADAGEGAPVLTRFAGVAVDLARSPVAELALGFDGLEMVRTNPRGEFAITCSDAPRLLCSLDPRWCTVVAARVDSGVDGPLVVVVASARRVAGRVLDAARAPIAGASVELAWFPGDGATLLEGLASAAPCAWRVLSAADGSFEIASGPDGVRMLLRADAEGFRPLVSGLMRGERLDCELRLEREHVPPPPVCGRVVHAGGEPAAGATVRFGPARANADAEGRFELQVPCRLEEVPLVATLAGFQPAVREGALLRAELRSQPPALELRLGPESLELAGRLQQSDGAPAKGWRVALLDPTLLDPLAPEGDTVERASARDHDTQRTDVDGAFRLAGLRAREYRVVAWRGTARGLEVVVSSPAAAGTEELRLASAAQDLAVRLAVRVTDPLGNPLSGARVGLPGGPALITVDGEGLFELCGDPRTSVSLLVAGEGFVPALHELDLGRAGGCIEVALMPQAAVRVSIPANGIGPDAVCAFDAAGRPVAIGADPTASWLALDGASSLAHVSSAARALSFWKGGRELGTKLLIPTAGELEATWP